MIMREITGLTNDATSLIYIEVQLKAKRRAMEQLKVLLFGSKSYRTKTDPNCDFDCNTRTASVTF